MRIIADIRSSIRSLWRAPSFTLLAVTVLGLGIGASTAMFSAVNALLLNSVPYPAPQELVVVADFGPEGAASPVAFGTFREIEARSRSLSSAAVMRRWSPALAGNFEPEQLAGQRVSAAYFDVLGVAPIKGAGFDAQADRPGGPNQVLLSHALWQRRFAGDLGIIGREIKLDDQSFEVVAVMPPGFRDVFAPASQVWTLLQYDSNLPSDGREWGKHLRMVARLQPGASLDSLRQELLQIGSAPDESFARPSHASLQRGALVAELQDELTRAVKPGVLSAFAAVVLLLLIACVNVANLLLVRGSQRRREFEARAALGASPARLIWQQLSEVLCLSAAGGGLGLLLAHASTGLLIGLMPADAAGAGLVIDARVLAFAVLVSTTVGVAVGLFPALRASRLAARGGLQPMGQRVLGHQRSTRNALVVLEVALAVVLLVGAGLLGSSLNRLFAVEAGFDPERLLTLQLNAAGSRYQAEGSSERFFDEALSAMRELPGVQAAAFTNQLPLSEDSSEFGTQFEALPDDSGPGIYNTLRYAVSPGYFDTMAIPLLLGRGLSESDTANAPRSVVISQSLAQKRFGSSSPLGRRLRIGGAPDTPWFTVVGVAGDVKQTALTASQVDAVYVTSAQWHFPDSTRSLVLRFEGDEDNLLASAQQAVWQIDAQLPIARTATMEKLMADGAKDRRFASLIFLAFGMAALLLAAMGIYSALSVSVSERSNEIGLRMALGAQTSTVLAWVMRQAMGLVGLGILFGLLLASISTRVLQSLLFGISATDPLTFALAAGVLALIGFLACLAPLRRALSVDPAHALRWE